METQIDNKTIVSKEICKRDGEEAGVGELQYNINSSTGLL